MSSDTDPAAAPVDICGAEDLTVDRGTAALVDGRQLAVFLLDDGSVHAVQQLDPYSGANVLSRGLVGTHALPGDPGEVVPTLASPMYKQAWNLSTGEVLDAGGGDERPIAVHDAEVRDGRVLVAARPRPLAPAQAAAPETADEEAGR